MRIAIFQYTSNYYYYIDIYTEGIWQTLLSKATYKVYIC